MADLKISQLTSATLPLAGTEVLPIVQSSSTKKVSTDDLTVKNVRSNATTGILQIAGPAAAATRTMTVPDANFTAARTDAAQSFTGDQTLGTGNLIQGTAGKGVTTGGSFGLGLGTNGSTSQFFVDTGGNVLAGMTSNIANVAGSVQTKVADNNGNNVICWNAVTSGDAGFIGFGTGSSYTQRGFIYYNSGAGQTQLSATSDYRAKEVSGPTKDALSKIMAMRVVDAKLKWAEGNAYPMFIAHELAEVAPWAVVGKKDAVDENGQEKYQSVSYDSLVATLTAAIQELKAEVDSLKSQLKG